jgi:cytochrome c
MKHLKQLTLILIISAGLFFISCGGGGSRTEEPSQSAENAAPSTRGVGEVKHVDISDPMDEQMIKNGKMVYDMKCAACHKLTDQRVVGPGWSGVTNRRTPEWIMNMITDTDMMLDSDPEAQAMLEECLVRMPNQHLSVGDARDILEFMRQNDLDQTGKKDEGKGG